MVHNVVATQSLKNIKPQKFGSALRRMGSKFCSFSNLIEMIQHLKITSSSGHSNWWKICRNNATTHFSNLLLLSSDLQVLNLLGKKKFGGKNTNYRSNCLFSITKVICQLDSGSLARSPDFPPLNSALRSRSNPSRWFPLSERKWTTVAPPGTWTTTRTWRSGGGRRKCRRASIGRTTKPRTRRWSNWNATWHGPCSFLKSSRNENPPKRTWSNWLWKSSKRGKYDFKNLLKFHILKANWRTLWNFSWVGN